MNASMVGSSSHLCCDACDGDIHGSHGLEIVQCVNVCVVVCAFESGEAYKEDGWAGLLAVVCLISQSSGQVTNWFTGCYVLQGARP
jgi:lysylphosphatidylglycerol synthetase-like protein (DUF2156 family)